MNKKKVLIKNISSLGLVQVANLVLPLISVPIISRILGPEKFGIINYAAAFVVYFNLLIDYGFNLTATRRIAKDPDNEMNRNEVFSEVLSAKIILFLISVALFLVSIHIIEPLSKEKLVATFSFITCIATMLTQNWIFQAMQNLSKVAILNFVSKLLFTIIIILVIRKQEDYIWYPLVTSLIALIVAAISFKWAVHTYKIKFVFVKIAKIKEMLWKEKTIFFSMVVVSLYTTTNIVILGIIQSAEQVGIYTAAQRLIMIAMSVINIPLTQALFPFIGQAFGENYYKGLKTVQQFIPLLSCFLFIMVVGMYILGPFVLKLLYGEAFLSAIPIFRVLCILPLLIGISNTFGVQVMLNINMDKAFFFVTATGAVIGLICNVIFTHWWGSLGTAINWVLVECLIMVMMFFVLTVKGIKVIDIKDYSFSALKDSISKIKSGIKNKN